MIEFVDAPPAGFAERTSEHDAIAAALKNDPTHRWGLIMRNVSQGHSSAINKGKKVSYRPAGSFEAVSRRSTTQDGKYDVYARYVGNKATALSKA